MKSQLIGDATRVIDPIDGQLRPNICVYNTGHICALRIVPLAAGKSDQRSPPVKLQIVFFDDFGIIEGKTDLPQDG